MNTTAVSKKNIEIKQFRADVAKLKKAGLIPSTNTRGKSVNAKTARPEQLVHGKRLIDYVRDRDNRAVLDGNAITIAKSTVSDTQGFKVKKPGGSTERVIVPVAKDAKVSVEKGNIVIKHDAGNGSITRVMLPRKNLKQYLLDAETLPELPGSQRYAFYYYGNKSHRFFDNPQQLIEYVTKYDEIEKGNTRDAFRNLEIVKLDRQAVKNWERDVTESVRKHRQGSPRRKERRRIANVPEHKRPALRKQRRDYRRRKRANT